jgi:hypothetical protein
MYPLSSVQTVSGFHMEKHWAESSLVPAILPPVSYILPVQGGIADMSAYKEAYAQVPSESYVTLVALAASLEALKETCQ